MLARSVSKDNFQEAEKTESSLGGVYKASMTSESPLGTFTCEGTVTIAPLLNNDYEIQTCLNQTSFPSLNINPVYVRAFASPTESETPGIWNYNCSGELYWKISFFTIRNDDALNVKFHDDPASDRINFSFKKNAFSFFGYETGTIDNTGTLERVSKVISADDEELVNCPADVLAQNIASLRG